MRLSDAIALGRMLIEPNDGTFTLSEGRGCACGMALAAVGEEIGSIGGMGRHFGNDGYKMWSGISDRYFQVVAGRMTLDQLIDWVRANEPTEATPVAEEKTIDVLVPSLVAQG